MKDLRLLPKVRDSWSYLYVEHCRVDQQDKAIAIHDKEGRTAVPCAMLALLMLGPGTTITHAAIRALADNGCMVAWCGEEGVRLYAFGTGETRSSRNLLAQVRLYADPALRLRVVHCMYRMRFAEDLDPSLPIEELRGKEGVRVREAYARASGDTGVAWQGRLYKSSDWRSADPVNRALSCANSCLYGVCHAAIVSAGFSPALGFIHTGKTLSFVYDIADLYKVDLTIPVAFRAAAEGPAQLETRTRRTCRDMFRSQQLLERIIPDIERALGMERGAALAGDQVLDSDDAVPGGLWDPAAGQVPGGVNRAAEPQRKEPQRQDSPAEAAASGGGDEQW